MRAFFSPSSRLCYFNSCRVRRRILRLSAFFSPSSHLCIFNSYRVRRKFIGPRAFFYPSPHLCIFNSCHVRRRFLRPRIFAFPSSHLRVLFHVAFGRFSSCSVLCFFLMHFWFIQGLHRPCVCLSLCSREHDRPRSSPPFTGL